MFLCSLEIVSRLQLSKQMVLLFFNQLFTLLNRGIVFIMLKLEHTDTEQFKDLAIEVEEIE